MAIFTITNGESTELAVVKVNPIIEECFTLYEYIVTTNNGDSISIELSGNHYEAKYFDNAGNEISFSDTTTLVYNIYLKVRFLLLNSGVTGVYPNATINIKNTTLDKYYENYVERDNDNPNCYDNIQYVQSVTGTAVDNTDPLNPIIDFNENEDYIQSITGGNNIEIDNTDSKNPIINYIHDGYQVYSLPTTSLTDSSNVYTYTTSNIKCQYAIIGNIVSLTIILSQINTSGTGPGGSLNLNISSLPFNIGGANVQHMEISTCYNSNLTDEEISLLTARCDNENNISFRLKNQVSSFNNIVFTNGSITLVGTLVITDRV